MFNVYLKDLNAFFFIKDYVFKPKAVFMINNLSIFYFFRKPWQLKYTKKIHTDIWLILRRLESIGGFLPKLNKINLRLKNKKKFCSKSILTFKCSINEKFINNFIENIFILNIYKYISYLINLTHKYSYLQEIAIPILKKKIIISQKNIFFFFKFYVNWTDFNKKFTKYMTKRSTFRINKLKKNYFSPRLKSLRSIKSYELKISISSFFKKIYFILFINIIKNINKLLLFFYKLGRNNFLKI